ncbi:MAG: hypothetical protein AVDCRST_MAG68-3639 [uncultured Gemmatimonadetes bacterium]|uniref:Uncharacterized protein n=1 Tax=uncultured Gemmatimonadota bacterium TaxID=203437 RepID=A0A6J4M7Z5_9BACT|nr:MAG: hypothetical protein AVDCRST_MAG68-3639 [uncultured Gemmatimonadota bacterium]
MLKVAVNWPRPAAEPDLEDFPTFTLSIQRAEGTSAAKGPHARAANVLLASASSFLVDFGGFALADGFTIRASPPRSYAGRVPEPRVCHTKSELAALVAALGAGIGTERHLELYPLSMWFYPARAQGLENFPELLRELPWDEAIWDDALARGLMRLSLDEDWFDLTADWAFAHRAVAWAQAACACSAKPVLWSPWFEDE